MTSAPEPFVIPIGPQHPALKEPGNFQFTVDGEVVTDAVVRLGYAHRGIEKATEQRNWTQGLYLLERVCGICSHIHSLSYALAVEKLAGVEAPPRAEAIRVLIAEMERIHSHLLWLGVAAHEAGFDTLFMYSWRDRETIMDLLEGFTGNRVNYSANVLGGVKWEVTPELADDIRRGMDSLEERTHHYLKVSNNDASFLQRTRGVGTMTRHQAELLGVVGPTARASGVARDIRIEAPYSAYHDYPVNLILDTAGDVEARFTVRLRELFESYRLVRQILDTLPEGPLTARMPRKIKEGEAMVRVEAPRGELFYYVSSGGGESPLRVHARTPTIANMTSVVKLAVGHEFANVPMLLVGIDPCFSCNDRAVSIRQDGDEENWTWDRLRRYSSRYFEERLSAQEGAHEGK
jgi:ech hydrogenase subunit E